MIPKCIIKDIVRHLPYLSLVAMASFAAFEMPPDQRPYAFSASACGIIFGLYGLFGGQDMPCSVVKAVVDSGVDFIPLSLMNIEIFLAMGKPYAMVHALFIIPLVLDVIAKLFGDEGDDQVTQMLKHVNNLANLASLGAISYIDNNYMYASVCLSFFIAQSTKVLRDKICGYEDVKDAVYIFAFDAFFYSSMVAITGKGIEVKAE